MEKEQWEHYKELYESLSEEAERYGRKWFDKYKWLIKHPHGNYEKEHFYPTDWTDNLRESIRKRDGYICQICGSRDGKFKRWSRLPDTKLVVHHIDYDKDNLNPDNLITLCKSCHAKTNFRREYWIKYFKSLKNS